MKIFAALLAGLLAVSGCTTMGSGATPASLSKPLGESGRKGGADMAAAMAGGLIGGDIGKGLNASDKRKALAAEYQALEYSQGGQAVTWTGGSAGRSGTVVPAQPYRVGSQDCRQYNHTVIVDGVTQSARGTACRNADGSWTTLS